MLHETRDRIHVCVQQRKGSGDAMSPRFKQGPGMLLRFCSVRIWYRSGCYKSRPTAVSEVGTPTTVNTALQRMSKSKTWKRILQDKLPVSLDREPKSGCRKVQQAPVLESYHLATPDIEPER